MNCKPQKNNTLGVRHIYLAKPDPKSKKNTQYYYLVIKQKGINITKVFNSDKYTLEEVVLERDSLKSLYNLK